MKANLQTKKMYVLVYFLYKESNLGAEKNGLMKDLGSIQYPCGNSQQSATPVPGIRTYACGLQRHQEFMEHTDIHESETLVYKNLK